MQPAAEPAPDLDDEPPPRFTETDPVELDEAFDDAGLGGTFLMRSVAVSLDSRVIAGSVQRAAT